MPQVSVSVKFCTKGADGVWSSEPVDIIPQPDKVCVFSGKCQVMYLNNEALPLDKSEISRKPLSQWAVDLRVKCGKGVYAICIQEILNPEESNVVSKIPNTLEQYRGDIALVVHHSGEFTIHTSAKNVGELLSKFIKEKKSKNIPLEVETENRFALLADDNEGLGDSETFPKRPSEDCECSSADWALFQKEQLTHVFWGMMSKKHPVEINPRIKNGGSALGEPSGPGERRISTGNGPASFSR
jgi:hypothetical protein